MCTDHAAELAALLPLHDPTDRGVRGDTWDVRVWGCREQGEQGRLGHECREQVEKVRTGVMCATAERSPTSDVVQGLVHGAGAGRPCPTAGNAS